MSSVTAVLAVVVVFSQVVSVARAQDAEVSPEAGPPATSDAAPPTNLGDPEPQPDPSDSAAGVESQASFEESRAKLYGYIDAHVEKQADEPVRDENGDTAWADSPIDWDVPGINVMMQATHGGRYRAFLNLRGDVEDGVEVRNAWVEASLYGDFLNVRLGKTYRPFGLYNEILDATPTYIGIEPPELFDSDHLMLTRTTFFMVRGTVPVGSAFLNYALTTGPDERAHEQFPLGIDLNVDIADMLKIGTSFYSSMGEASAGVSVGEGQSSGGVLPWMAKDEFMIYGGYAQLSLDSLLVQAEFWVADHDAERDPEQVLLLADAGLNPRQTRRFGLENGAAATVDDVRTDGDHQVQTFYVRAGYGIEFASGAELVPYVQYDYYRNPEIIQSEDFGGDDEAGLADDGRFHKATAGVVYRPVPVAALKLDGSTHIQRFNGETEMYPEIRLSFSYLWSL